MPNLFGNLLTLNKLKIQRLSQASKLKRFETIFNDF